MGKVTVFEVQFSNSNGVYIAGQLLQGHVNLELSKSLKLKDIRLKIRGKAFVHWTDQNMRGPGESRFREIRHHFAREQYIDWSHSLLGKTTEPKKKRELAAGQYTYPFQFQLPSNVPTSFEGQYGYVRYWVKATLERPWKHDQSAKKLLTFICPVDLNRDPSTSKSIQSQKTKRLCCLCCRSGPVSAVLSLSQRGFVPGETIHISAEVSNMTRRKMAGSSVALLMTVLYYTPTKSRAMTHQILKVKRGPIPAGESEVWENEKMIIPPLPPSSLNGCRIIDVKYTLELRVEPVGPAFQLQVPVEIVVGTVPLSSVVQQCLAAHHIAPPSPGPHAQQPPSLNQEGTHAQQQSSLSHAGGHHGAALRAEGAQHRPPQYFISPRFAHYVFGHCKTKDDDEDDEWTRVESHFTPFYVYYTWQPEELQLRKQQGVRFAA